MTKDHYIQIKQANYIPKLVKFIDFLHISREIPLNLIDVNDWQCNYKPAVYVHTKHSLWRTRRYCRGAYSDVDKAISFINNPKGWTK